MSQEQQTIIITTRRLDYKGSQQFFEQIDQAYKNGYEILKSGLTKDAPRLGSIPRVVMCKVGTNLIEAPESLSDESSAPSPSVGTTNSLEPPVEAPMALEDMSKKDELLAYAESLKIEIPSNLKQPAAIKKFLQEYTQSE